MDTVFKALFFRQPLIHYVSPPVCENLFSSSSGPVIVLNALSKLYSITGLVQGGLGNFWLVWGSYPGAICYSVYMSQDPNDPAGTYVIVAECIPNPEFDLSDPEFGSGYYIVTAITPEGETPFGDPIYYAKPPQQCPHFDPPIPGDLNVDIGDDVTITFIVNEGAGFGAVHYLWFKDGNPILDTTNTTKASLHLPSVSETDEGVYTLQLSNDDPACDVFSADVDLNVKNCPSIIDPQPDLDVNATVGDNVTLGPFNVDEAEYPGLVTYEWFKDGVLFSDTTGTTQGSLAFIGAAEADSGIYILHISASTSPCDEDTSDAISFSVTPPGGCGITPTNVEDMVWSDGFEVVVPGCQEMTMAGGSGTVSLKVESAFPWYYCGDGTGHCCNSAASADKIGQICNPGAAYNVTVSMSYVSAGPVTPWEPTVQLNVFLDGVSQGAPTGYCYTDTPNPLSVTFSLPPGPHSIRIYVPFQGVAWPIESGNSLTLNGTISVTPATHP